MTPSDPVAAVLEALLAPTGGQQISTSFAVPSIPGGSVSVPFTMTINTAVLGRLVDLVAGHLETDLVIPEPPAGDRMPVPTAQPQAPLPPIPLEVIEARKSEAEAEREAWEASPEAAAMRAERDAARKAKAERKAKEEESTIGAEFDRFDETIEDDEDDE